MRIKSYMDDVYVYTAHLPASVNGVTVIRGDDYLVFINDNKCPEKQNKALQHELEHIKRGHLYNDLMFIAECEIEAQRA